jgi:hypothetical protein
MRLGLAAVFAALLSLSFGGGSGGSQASVAGDARAAAEVAAGWILGSEAAPGRTVERRLRILREQVALNGFRRRAPLREVDQCRVPHTRRTVGPCFALPVVARPDESSRLEGDVYLVVRERRGRLVVDRGWYSGEALVCDAGFKPVRRGPAYDCVEFRAW